MPNSQKTLFPKYSVKLDVRVTDDKNRSVLTGSADFNKHESVENISHKCTSISNQLITDKQTAKLYKRKH